MSFETIFKFSSSFAFHRLFWLIRIFRLTKLKKKRKEKGIINNCISRRIASFIPIQIKIKKKKKKKKKKKRFPSFFIFSKLAFCFVFYRCLMMYTHRLHDDDVLFLIDFFEKLSFSIFSIFKNELIKKNDINFKKSTEIYIDLVGVFVCVRLCVCVRVGLRVSAGEMSTVFRSRLV